MKALLTFLGFTGATAILAAVATGLLVSVNSGRTSWLLMGVFLLDSIALLVVATHIAYRKLGGPPGPRE